ncbi:RRQRL motif-containing zinc-binding protein [Streptomyces sioyaensis]|uniref:RRQRL motif-containing zinc-binding protein n=1 Tax=Streptomyces sioyaensis TaxID=67364 RepID=UPI00378C03EB
MSRPRFWDPDGTRYGIPTYPYRLAPDGLATRRQLRAQQLRPGGQDVAAQILWRSRRARGGIRAAYLFRIDLAKPVRQMTPARWAAIDAALAARRICRACGMDRGYTIPTSLGVCVTCADVPALAA